LGEAKRKAEALAKQRADDNQHMGFTSSGITPIEKLVAHCNDMSARMDAFEARKHQREVKDIKPRTKDNMQTSQPHPKEVS
jgi:hypothetical protein